MNKMFGLVLFAVMVCLVHRVECDVGPACDPDDESYLDKWDFFYTPRQDAEHLECLVFSDPEDDSDKVRVIIKLSDNMNFTLTELVVKYKTDYGLYGKRSKIVFKDDDNNRVAASVINYFDDWEDLMVYKEADIVDKETNKLVVHLYCPGASYRDGICQIEIVTLNGYCEFHHQP